MRRISIILCVFLCMQIILIPFVTTYAASALTAAEGKKVQQKLKDLGYYDGKVNGKFESSYKALNVYFEDKGVTTSKGKPRVVSSSNTWSDISEKVYKEILGATEKGISKLDRSKETDKSFLKAVIDCKAYTAAHGFKYCFCNSYARVNLNKSERHYCSKHNILSASKKYVTNCSDGVTAAIFEYAKINDNEDLKNRCRDELKSSYIYASIATDLKDGGKDKNFKVIKNKDNVQVGDILYSKYNGVSHVEIYAGKQNGKIMVYNWGNNTAIADPGKTVSNVPFSEVKHILRLKPIESMCTIQ